MKQIITIVLILHSIQLISQEKLDLDLSNSCSFNGAPISGEIYGFTSSSEAVKIIDEIVGHIGLKRNFKIEAGNVPNAAAAIRPTVNGNERYIVYSQNFMSHIINESNSYWAAIGIMAHEVAHHLNGHTLTAGGSRPPTELEADEFAGFVLYKMGATLEQAQSMFNNRTMYQPYDSRSHPATSARLEAVAVGYQKSKEKSGNTSVSSLPNNRQPINTPTNYPNNNTSTYYPNNTTYNPNVTSRKETLTSEDVQYISANLNGHNLEFQIIKDKRLLMVTSKSISSNGEQNVNVGLVGKFILYQYGGQDFYSIYFSAMNSLNGSIFYYTLFVDSYNDIYIGPNNNPQNLTKVGNLKFDWGLSSSYNQNTSTYKYPNNSSSKRQIYFKNECGYKVKLAFRYRYDNENWVTKSWYTFDPNENSFLSSNGNRLETNNRTIYYYAEMTDYNYSWKGDESRLVGNEYYDMRKATLEIDSDGDYVLSINCNNKD